MLGIASGRDDNADPRVSERPAQERLSPALQPERAELAPLRGRNLGAGPTERTHADHAEAELLGQRQDPLLHPALPRVERDLDRVDPAGAHHLFELVEAILVVLRGAEEADQPRFALPLEPGKPLPPGDEVVDLLEVDPAAEEAQLGGELRLRLLGRGCPDLRGHERSIAQRAERLAEDSLGSAVHRRGVDDTGTPFECGLDDHSRLRDALWADVENLPGAEADDGKRRPAAAERAGDHADILGGRAPIFGADVVVRCAQMSGGSILATPELSLGEIDARSSGENFPVVSLLAPPQARPHLRAVYGFARLVDTLGDEATGDREALLDELERELDRCYDGVPNTEIMRRLKVTIDACGLPREPFWRLIEANRVDQRTLRYETWDDLRTYCTFSAEPVGRLVLGIYGHADEQDLASMSDDVCTGLQLVNFLQDPPRDLALGRVYLPQEDLRRFSVREEELAGPGSDRFATLCRFEAARAAALLQRGLPLARRIGGRTGRSIALFARGGLAALRALERSGWDVFTARPAPRRATFALLTLGELLRG